jgi:hypothetical protein
MANLSYSNTPLIADLYDTPEAAIAASANLGCSGYRTYNINGQNKYVPCSTYLAYEQALKFVKRQGVLNAISGKGNIGDKAVGLQFANSNNEISGDPFFTLGNFSINTSVSQKPAVGKTAKISPETRTYTAASINDLNPNKNTDATTNLVDTINAKIENNLTVTILFDKKKLENYVLYSPLKETVKNTIVEISQKYPASLKLNVISLLSPTVSDYSYNTDKDTSEFKININNIENPFGIEYTVIGTTITDDANITPLRNFSKKYSDFVLYYNDTEYKILNVTLPSSKTDTDNGIYLVVQGNPFDGVANNDQTVNTTFWLKPSLKKFDEFQSSLSDMGKFLMDYDYELKRYISVIRYTKVTDSGVRINTEEQLIFPQSDKHNIDIFTSDFDAYLTKLNQISDDFDATKTNLITRFLTTDSLKEFDTDDRRINLMFGLIGKNFDNIRKYIDGITFMTNLTYDKIENIPDLLVKNFGNMLGFETYNVEDENTIIESLFSIKDLNVEPGLTPAEIDIELWRRIFINAYYLWKSKGTRKSIEFILNLVGLPDSIFEINEHVYMARNPINYTDKSFEIYGGNYSDEVLLTLLPFDKDGYPTVPYDVRYQESGFTTTNDGRNFGPYDFGKQYIQAFEKRGNVSIFTVDRYTDNVKSWVYSTEEVLRLSEDSVGYTEYYEPHSKLVINSKELEVYLASDKIFDLSVYRYYNRNAVDINSDLTFTFVPTINGGDLTFNQFLQKSLDNYIKPDNRKTIKTYPTLTKIYYDYLNSVSSPMTNTKDLEFLSYFDSSWVKLVQQFTPATTILNAGKKIQNSKFMDNKFIYKHGLNNSLSWLGTDGSEFQDLAKKTVNQGLTNPFSPIGIKKLPIAGESSTFTLVGLKGKNYLGYDPTISEYFGFYYGIEEACASEVQIYKWEKNVNYGDDAIYGGNINTGSGDRKGVYVTYDNNLYRLNTDQMHVSGYTINTDPTPYTDNFIYLEQGLGNPDTETITLPNGPGKYLVEFTIYGQDTIVIYDGLVSGTELDSINGLSGSTVTYSDTLTFTTNQISIWNALLNPSNISVTNLSIGLVSNIPNSFDVYDLIPLNVDASTLTFKDSTLTPISIAERNYYIEAISFGHAHLVADVDFVCPIPKPHTCYFNFSGNTISMTGATSYYDESGKYLTIEQSKYYGYSKYTGTTEPDNAVYGTASNWVIPYQKQNAWTNGVIYYAGDVVTKSSVNYLVTGATVTGYTVTGTPSGTTLTSIVPGLYQNYTNRTITDPYMHINSAYLKKILVNPLLDRVSFNLTKSLYLYQVYSGATDQETYKVIDNLLNDELYITDSNTLSFDGFYSLDEDKIGPFYTPDADPIGTQTLVESIDLVPNKNNYVDFESLNTNFNIVNSNISLGQGFYLIKRNKYFKFDIDLFFESELVAQQSVIIKLINKFGALIYQQLFTFSGGDESALRVVNFTHEGVFFTDTQVYLAIEPVTQPCKLSRYETIDVDYADGTTYDSLDDPRFRVYFNGGRSLINNAYFDDALSIEPIGYNDDHTVDNYLLKIENFTDTHQFIPKLNINQSYDEGYNFGLLYGQYFEKYKNTSQIGDVTSYEKKFNNDYVDFELTVRSKELNDTPQYYASNLQIYNSFAGAEKTYTISSSKNYLGNTPQAVENTSITKNIFIGKTPKPRTISLNKPDYPFLKLHKNDVAITGTTIDFMGYDDGLIDYNHLDFNSNLANSLISKKRYKLITGTTYGYWKKENDVYKTKLYQDILSAVQYFSTSINNYVINDIVKLKLSDYRKVVESTTGTTVVTTDVDRLYVCVEDITDDHLCKITGASSKFEIHPIYRPNGARTCFIPIENYNLKNFTPIGYDKQIIVDAIKSNVAPYRYREPILLDGSPTQKLNLGDIVKVYASGTGTTINYNLYEYIYNKPLTWDSTNDYFYGEIVYHPNTGGTNSFWYAPSGITVGVSPTGGTGAWYEMPITGTNANSPFWFKDITGVTAISTLYFSGPTVYKIKNLLPTVASSAGYSYYLPLTGTTNIVIADSFYTTLPGETNGITENSDITAYFRVTGSTLNYTGTSNSLMTFSATQDTNLIQNSYNYTPSGGFLDPQTVGQVIWMYINRPYGIQPLFYNVGTTATDNGILDFIATGTTYNSSSNYHSKKYTVSRNVLYRTVAGIGTFTGATEPHLSTNWEERDFMLVKKFTFKKDRCRVKIYQGTIESVNTITKNNLYFFDSNLRLKPSFTEQTFSGATKNNKLLTGVNKLFDAKNTNLRSVRDYGLTGFRRVGSDIIMDYYYEKDDSGLPLTGEFIGGLTITNPCGHTAKTIFGALFEADLTKLDQLKPRVMSSPALPENTELITGFKPEVRLIINQNGASNVTVIVENNTAGTTVFNKVLTKNKYFDENIIVNYGEFVTITIKTDVTRNLTRYASGFMDNYTLFDANDNGIENGYFASTKTNVGRLVTRTIKLKDISEGRVVKIDFDGATLVTLETVDPRDYIKLPKAL